MDKMTSSVIIMIMITGFITNIITNKQIDDLRKEIFKIQNDVDNVKDRLEK